MKEVRKEMTKIWTYSIGDDAHGSGIQHPLPVVSPAVSDFDGDLITGFMIDGFA